MSQMFSSVARVAIEEMVRKHAQVSKFGFFLSEDSLNDLVEDLSQFLQTSRSLKEAGDRFLQGATSGVKESGMKKPLRI